MFLDHYLLIFTIRVPWLCCEDIKNQLPGQLENWVPYVIQNLWDAVVNHQL